MPNKSKQMMLRQLITFPLVFIALTILLPSCKNRKSRVEQHHSQTTVIKPSNNEPSAPTTNDTLQFIHFEGNYDYWSCVFLNSKKDTVTLVTDTVISGRYRNRMFLVTYFTDTLYQAGDNDSKFTALRMSNFKVLGRKPFVDPITEQQILQDVWNLQEVQSGADQVL
ncbi:hypothetical protein [Pedobacter sp. Leaf176]|uniref:hypothetical protein n=1 Tax=Pedobacter sp. Leaf176 TaxID=1736286 RepID=UPI0012FAD674|nr:hypothetical protein [Pedobacter sp. Leaf176]